MIIRCFHLLKPFIFLLSFDVSAKEDVAAGLIDAPGVDLVKSQCTICHSSQLILSQRLSRKDWISMIRWMQSEQGLWQLGDLEEPILSYLTNYYGPYPSLNHRRKPLGKKHVKH